MSFTYAGSELALFAEATNWKRYWTALVRPWLGRRVLEVGAGIGSNIPLLFVPPTEDWFALEPDAGLAQKVQQGVASGALPAATQVKVGTCRDIGPGERFDSVLYVDVLEHILDDAEEIRAAAGLLRPGGNLVVMGPAHPLLFSSFDASIGHFRRYNPAMLRAISPEGCGLRLIRHLDCVGLFASLANRFLLHQPMPSPLQIAAWDRRMVPLSRHLDPLFGYMLGKSILAVWSRQ